MLSTQELIGNEEKCFIHEVYDAWKPLKVCDFDTSFLCRRFGHYDRYLLTCLFRIKPLDSISSYLAFPVWLALMHLYSYCIRDLKGSLQLSFCLKSMHAALTAATAAAAYQHKIGHSSIQVKADMSPYINCFAVYIKL